MAENYNGTIELISGITPKNNGDFALVNAKDVAFYENDATGETQEIRLTDKINQVGVSEEDKNQIILDATNASKAALFADERFTITESRARIAETDIGSRTDESNTKAIFPRIEQLEADLAKASAGDNAKLKVDFKTETSTLYLYEGDQLILPDEQAGIEGNVISSTPVSGGGSGTAASYKLNLLRAEDEKEDKTVLYGNKVTIAYDTKLVSVQDENTLLKDNVTLFVYINDELKKSIVEPAGLGKTMDITDLIPLGSTTVKVTASYTETIEDTGEKVTIRSTQRWYIDAVQMYLTSTFNDAAVQTSEVSYTYVPYGNLEKTVYFILDGKEFSKTTTSLSNKTLSITIPMQSHGSHTLEVYCTGKIEETTIESEHLYYDIMFAEANNNTPIIRAVIMSKTKEQYTLIPIEYSVYQANSLMSNIELKAISINQVTETVDGQEITKAVVTEEFKSSLRIDQLEQTWNYIPSLDGHKILTITCGDEVKTLEFDVAAFPHEIVPVTGNLALDFNPQGRTNQDENYNEFNYNGYDWTLSDNFDWTNGGWQTDAEGNTYFCVKAGTTATFNYNLFADANTMGSTGAQGNGKEFKIVFKTANVADTSATWLSCIANTEQGKPVGIQMDMHNGYVMSDIKSLTIPYSEEDIIEFDINIIPFGSSNQKDIPMIMTYEDGTPVQPLVINPTEDSSISFTQENPVPITIGSEYCDVHIYRMKAYSKFLSDEDILNNFIADARTGTEKANRYTRNQIYDAITGKLTPEGLAKACPHLRIFKVTCPRFTTSKSDKVTDTTIQLIYENGDPNLDNWTATQCQHNGQGTSSNAYGFAGRNLDFVMNKSGVDGVKPVIKYKDGTSTDTISLTRTSVPTNYLNVKVNIASSDNANNALLQKRYNRYLPYVQGSAVWQQFAKNSMEFYNCVVFVKEKGYNDLVVNQDGSNTVEPIEFSDNEFHFYAIGNVGDSKKTDNTRAADPEDKKEFCVEIMDWNLPLSNFPTDTMVKASGYYKTEEKEETVTKEDEDTETVKTTEIIYTFLKDENLGENGILFEKNDNQYIHSLDETIDWEHMDKYFVDILEQDDFSEDFTYGFRYLEDDEDPVQRAEAKAKWIEFYRFITRPLNTTEEIAAWKAEFSDWFIEDAAFFYYLYTLRYTMVDNRAKNSFWHYGKVAVKNVETGLYEYAKDKNGDFIYKFDFWDYDNDTALGIDNAGKLEMSYGIEDNDKDAAGATYFRAADSTFFQRVAKYFATELGEKFRAYESANPNVFSSTHLIDEFDTWQSEFPEELWRLDYERKYKRTYVNGGGELWDNAIARESPETRFLADMMNGKKKYQRRQFERNQDFYMSSKFIGKTNNQDFIVLRGAGDLSNVDLVVPQDATLHIKPYLNMYVNLSINNTGTYYLNQRCYAGQEYEIPYPTDKFEFNYIYGASRIQSLGDLSPMYLQTATLGKGAKLKEIILGNETVGYKNNAISTGLEVTSNNKLLEIFDIQNLPSLSGSLPVAAIPSVKEVYAQGTAISNVTFAKNGLINKAYLPSTVNNLTLIDLYFLNTLELEGYDNLYQVVIENTPGVDEKAILEAAQNLIRFRVTDVDWTLQTTDLLNRLVKCKGIDEDGSTQINNSVLTGKVHINGYVRQSELDAYTAAWGDKLIVTYNQLMPQHNIIFKSIDVNTNNETILYQELVDQGTTLNSAQHDPIVTGKINTPATQYSDDGQFAYIYQTWNTADGAALDGITIANADVIFYAIYDRETRLYTVSWKDNDNDAAVDLYTTQVPWGTNAEFKSTLPQPKSDTGNNYYLFNGWDKTSTFITKDTVIYPTWVVSNPYTLGDKLTAEMSAEDIYGLRETKTIGTYFNAGGEKITMQLGYMPEYDNITSQVLIANKIEFDGATTFVDTDIELFNEDKGFTLAIDYEAAYRDTDITEYESIVSSYFNNKNGFKIVTNNNQIPQIWYKTNSVATNVGYTAPGKIKESSSDIYTHREICVIRKIKGDNNLYVYTNNRFSNTAVAETILQSTSFSALENIKLCFGAARNSEGEHSEYFTGKIYYAKIWNDDIGADECKKVCSWIYDTLDFEFVGANRYYYPETDRKCQATFVATKLLDDMIYYNNNTANDQKSKEAYISSDIRAWLNSKMLLGPSITWQQVIKPVSITSLEGSYLSNGSNQVNTTTHTTTDSFYIPAAAEVHHEYANDNHYKIELGLSTTQFKTFNDVNNRTRMLFNLNEIKPYWLRTPYKTIPNYNLGVNSNGEVDYREGGNTSEVFYRSLDYNKRPAGVLLCFSI